MLSLISLLYFINFYLEKDKNVQIIQLITEGK